MDGRSKRIKPCTSSGGGSSSSMGCWLPVEITAEIVKRLPTAASIGRFRCVSKSWYCLLSDPNFILQNTRSFDDNGTIDDDKKARFMIICDSVSSAVSLSYHTLQPVSPVLKLADVIPEIKLGRLKVGRCCDGIFCLYGRDSPYNIILWNPTTSDYRALPSLSPLFGSRRSLWINMGFGYDPLTKDYKGVALVKYAGDSRILCSVYLYSLRNNSWKTLCEWGDALIREEVFQSRYSSAKIERCYWLCYPNDGDGRRNWSVTSFDLSKHVFNTVLLPPLPSHSGESRYTSLSMSQDYLMTVTFDRSERTSYVWSLNYDMLEQGKECCWFRLYTVVNSTTMHKASSYVPAGIWEHGKCFVMDSEGRFHVVDLLSGGHSTLPIEGKSLNFCEIRAYIPSPMSLSSRRWANEACNMGGTGLCLCTSKQNNCNY